MSQESSSLPASSPSIQRISDAEFTVALHVLKQAVDATSSGIVITDPHLPDNPIIYYNRTFEKLTGYKETDVIGHNCRFLQGPDTDPASVAILRHAIETRSDCQVTLLNYQKNGTPFWNELYMSPVLEPRTGKLTHFIGVQNDVTARIEAEQERDRLLARQKRVADTLQETLLSLPAPDAFPGWNFHVLYKSAWDEARVGGDFFDTFALPGGETAFVVGDVTGKGLAAAAYTGQVKFALRVFLRDDPRPSVALARLNQFLFTAQRLDNLSQYALVSLALVVADARTGNASFGTAGAEPPLLLREKPTGGQEWVAVEGPLIGVLEDAEYDTTPQTRLLPGDTILLYTDGVTEARPPRLQNPDATLFGVERVAEVAIPCAKMPLDELSQTVYHAALHYGGGRLQDDVCVMAVRWTP